nr:hypothetical protein [Tanacetum cinerariifolium]
MPLTFADTHNMVAYLNKSDASKGFNKVIDFLNGSYIKYALTINPTIYVTCIKQFWNTVAVKQSNDVTRLQALVDRKKVVINEVAIRDILSLDDAEGVDCLPNEEVFAELARMGYENPSTKLTFYKAFFSSQWKFLIHTILQSMSAKRTSWNDFSSAMALAIIFLSTGADTAVSGDDVHDQSIPSPTPPTPPPQQPQDIPSTSQEALDAYAVLTRRVEHLEHDKVAQALEITMLKKRVKKLEKANKVKVLKLKRLKKVGTSQRIESSDDIDIKDASNQGRMIADLDRDEGIALMDDEGAEKKAEDAQVAGDKQVKGRQAEIYQINMDHALKVLSMQEDEPEVQEAVKVVTTAKLITEVVAAVIRVAAASTRRRKGVVIRDPEEESTAKTPAETKSKDKGKGIMTEEPKPMKKKQQVEMDKEYARKLHEELNKDIDWSVAIDHVKQKDKEDLMSYDDIRPIFDAKFNSNIKFLLKTKEQTEEEENRHLEIVPDEDDDLYTKATPLARKVLVVDYEIVHFNNKPHYKIIHADETHQLYVSFITLLKNFDREDLESLWSIVKERFFTSKPNNFSDDYLLTTLGAMFERPDGQAQVWKNQRTLILLVERRYPLSKFTLDQMLNAVWLKVEEQSEMPLELLSAAKQKLMLLDNAAKRRLMLLSQVKTVNDKC